MDNKRKIKKIATIIILVVFLVIGLSGLRIRSVGQYRQEQKQLAKEILVDESSGTDASTEVETNTPEPDKSAVQESDSKGSTASSDKGKSSGDETGSADRNGKSSDGTGSSSGKSKSSGGTASSSGKSKSSGGTANSSVKSKGSYTKASSSGKGKATKKPATAKPESRATQTPSRSDGSSVCSITIRCDSLLKHWDDLSDSVKKKVPESGFILRKTNVKVTNSDTAFSILQKVCKAKNIALDAEYSNVFSTEYIQGIGYLYEKEAGDMSGWLYRVNGKIPNYGSSGYQLQAGDDVEWVYTYTGEWE
ncbi:MAG: DUF4430 domain-containing protein [Lachnospiraceae bacterium]|nr:DUF4430 domain-containing protein [Lachnospiraceae bacterium]